MTINIAVCGAGAFGRNHIRIYRELAAAGAPVHLAAIVDPNQSRLTELAATGHQAPIPSDLSTLTELAPTIPPQATPNTGASSTTTASSNPTLTKLAATDNSVPIYPTTEALLAAIARHELHIDAASVCVPTSAHHAVAAQLLAANIHVLVEKPITATLPEADDLIALATRHNRVLQVGHLERFNPAVQALAPLLRGPMFFEAHRLSIFSPRSLDTDVVLDLMIHDLDIVLHLAQSPVTQVHAVGLPILSGKTDIANVRIEFASGCVANFTASRVSTERIRKLRFFQPHQYLSLDYARQDLLIIEVTPPTPLTSLTPPTPLTPLVSPILITSPTALTPPPALIPPTPLTALSPSLSVISDQHHPENQYHSKNQHHLENQHHFEKECHPEQSEGSAFPPAPQQTPDPAHHTPETKAAMPSPQTALPAPPTLPTLGMTKPKITPGEPLRLEIESFLQAIQTNTPPQVTAQQARAALALALQIQQAITTHAHHAGLQAFTTP